MSCTLGAWGTGFDVDGFLRTSSLEPDEVWHEGEPRGSKGDVKKTSGLTFYLLDDGLDSLADQRDAAIVFLRAHQQELKRLAEAARDHWFALKFGVRLRKDIAVWVDGLPPDLIRLAADVGCRISISHYPPDEDFFPKTDGEHAANDAE